MKAAEKWYIIDKIYEVCRFNKTSTELFKGIIKDNYKIKTEASNWPNWCNTEEEKEKYLKDFEEWHGFGLDRNKIEKNTGYKSVAKMFLNSLWGKFCQRDNMEITEFIKDPIILN